MAEHLPARVSAFREGCGVLRHSASPGRYCHTRHVPPGELGDWVEHFWLETWDFPDGASQTREVLPHPSVHLVFAPGRSRIYGVQMGRFARELHGKCRILGIKFHPGAFYPFLRKAVHSIANSSIVAARVFSSAQDAEEKILGCTNDQSMVDTAARFLMANLPPADGNVKIARHAVQQIVSDRNLTRVQHLVARSAAGERTLQRLFRRYVGTTPRWVIKRYRMYEALEHLTEGAPPDLTALAQNLGYFDQAHFTNDFKKLVGRAPSKYPD